MVADNGHLGTLHASFGPSRRRAAVVAPSVSVHRFWFGSWAVLRVEGEMDVQAGPLVTELIGVEVSHVAIELDGVTFMDACGLGILLDLRRRVGDAGLIQLVAPSEPVRRLLTLTDAERLFPEIVTADRAVAVLLATDPWATS
jgi:anti-anti-sigma factor